MTECRSPELQELLPEYVAHRLDESVAVQVAAHVEACGVCTEELAVLQLVRRARPAVAMPDVARIVAALPAPAVASRPVLRVEAGGLPGGQPDPTRSATPRPSETRVARGAFGVSVWRLAATLAVVVAGGASVLVARRGVLGVESAPGAAPVLAVNDAAGGRADTVSATVPTSSPSRAETVAVLPAARAAAAVSVSYGDLGDYSEAELRQMLERLERWDGATNTEPLPGVPLLPGSGDSDS